jgi:hypothetical protein
MELLDDLHARDESLLRALKVVDLLDLLVELLDLARQHRVSALLGIDHRAHQQVRGECCDDRCNRGAAQGDQKAELALATLFFTPGK